jgi:serine-type D-Ala-D-Ala carboxypeptidase/endopeptidase (penicillin-binding protein 4)
VAVGVGDRIVFSHLGRMQRLPASNEKLLTSMAALDLFGPRHRFSTVATARGGVRHGVLRGDLWLVGGGDPELASSGLASLAVRIRARGIRRITGSVVGDVRTFHRGWWAPGWIRGVSRNYVTRSTALALNGNSGGGSPELGAASALTASLRSLGVTVEGAPKTGGVPRRSRQLAVTRSASLATILARQNHGSINFDAEMITKAIGAEVTGRPGSTANGADALETWAADQGVKLDAFDGSGLSHRDRMSAIGMVTMLLRTRRQAWWSTLFRSLPSAGEGTLAGRLAGVDIHAKTGTLFVTPVSALSGYVRDADGGLLGFSIFSRGLSKSSAIAIEDLVVRTLTSAHVS